MVLKLRFIGLVAFALVGAMWPVGAQAAGGLGAAAGFSILAGTALTCTDATVTGLAGLASSTTAVTKTRCHMQAQVATTAFNDFLTVYNGIANNLGPCTQTFGIADTLAGVTLGPGIYCFPAAATLTGTLTLTGAGPWYFEIG
ncbi:MAG TPA: ice-binding family protein, partial [Candidatus Acidoferrum sp.]|nr:ice-binding family protein [Candidatus Acidoferrum sp.]